MSINATLIVKSHLKSGIPDGFWFLVIKFFIKQLKIYAVIRVYHVRFS